MKKYILSLLFLLFGLQMISAQKYFTRNGEVSFHSRALMEDIDAYNKQGSFVMDVESKNIQMAVLVKAFQFEKALMQEHFNENYMESDLYPKAVFKGKLESASDLDLDKEGSKIELPLKGQLSIRGISKEIESMATLENKDGKIHAKSIFEVKVADYEIKIPSIVKDKIAKNVEVRIDLELDKM